MVRQRQQPTDTDSSDPGTASGGSSGDEGAPIRRSSANPTTNPVINAEVSDKKHQHVVKWARRHMVLFYILAGIAPFLTLASAVFLVADHFSVPTYAWVPAVVMNAIEVVVVAGGLYVVQSKRFAADAWDLSVVVLPLWCGTFCATFTVCWGAAVEDTTDTVAEYVLWALCGVSRLLSLVFVVVALKYHLLLLEDPSAASNDKQKARYERRKARREKHHRRRHSDSD